MNYRKVFLVSREPWRSSQAQNQRDDLGEMGTARSVHTIVKINIKVPSVHRSESTIQKKKIKGDRINSVRTTGL